jgi:hypothetical protein
VDSSLHPTLAPQKFFNFLRAVRAFRNIERAIARDEWLSHRRRYMLLLLQWLAPQRQSSSNWGVERPRGAVYYSYSWSLDLVTERAIGHLTDVSGMGWQGAYRVHDIDTDTDTRV